ncbi:MAG: hypothetical protein ABSG94_08675 [Brevinematales bacterium]
MDGNGAYQDTIQEFSVNYSSDGGLWSCALVSTIDVAYPHYSVSGFVTASGATTNLNILYDSIKGSKHQLSGEAIGFGTAMNLTLFAISDYVSSANDAFAYVDVAGKYKVYFSSDRTGKGNYDLYRYNVLTFDKEVPAFLKAGF